jgi:hypothetical protein
MLTFGNAIGKREPPFPTSETIRLRSFCVDAAPASAIESLRMLHAGASVFRFIQHQKADA